MEASGGAASQQKRLAVMQMKDPSLGKLPSMAHQVALGTASKVQAKHNMGTLRE